MVLLLTGAVAWAQPAVVAAAPDDSASIRFNFKDATFEQVIDFFARSSGMAVVWEMPPPEGTLSYLSPETYTIPEGLRILNIILQSKNVMLRVEGELLYLQKLEDMQRENIPTFIGALPPEVTSDQIVTVVRPLEYALAKPLSEKLAQMVASYGSITPLEQQQALLITETAAQIDRLFRIIDEIDKQDPEGVIEIIKIRNARAVDLMEPLKALLSIKEVQYFIDQNGNRVKLEQDDLPGLNMTADVRTNSIVCKGMQVRIDKLKEALELLDVPATGGSRSVRTIALFEVAASDAAKQLEQLYAKLAEEKRPTILAMDDLGKITIVGDDTAIAEGIEILRELDGGVATDVEPGQRVMRVVALDHAAPAPLIAALEKLLTGRQKASTRMVAGPDGESLVIGGPANDVEAVIAVIPVLDRAHPMEREARTLTITASDAATALAKAGALFDEMSAGSDDGDIRIDADIENRTLLVVGSAKALDRFAAALRTVESNTVVTRETRRFALAAAEADAVAAALAPLARQMLTPRDGSVYVEPEITPVSPLDLLIVSALPDQFQVLDSLVTTLDRPRAEDFGFRVIPAPVADVDLLLTRAQSIYERLSRGMDETGVPDVEHDQLTGQVVVSGPASAVDLFERAVGEARRLLPPDRVGRLVDIANRKADEVAGPLAELLASAVPAGKGRVIPPPTIEVIDRTNSLFIVAEAAQHEAINGLIARLDTPEGGALAPLRILQVRAADAQRIADVLRERYDGRSAEQRRLEPVSVVADEATNSLVVTAHVDHLEEISAFVESVNTAAVSTTDTETMLFPLNQTRASSVAAALDKLYPEPPVPLDSRGRPMPHLRPQRAIQVTADDATNTLIVEAPPERRGSFEMLVAQLDRVKLQPTAVLRTYHVERGDLDAIQATLSELAGRGVLTRQPDDGGRPVDVVIEIEPVSRTLIVAGDEVTFETTEQLLTDLEAVPVPRSLRVFELAGGDIEATAERARALYSAQTADVPNAGPVDVEVDREAGVLLVVADDEAMTRFAGIVDELRGTIGPPPEVRLVPIEHASATEVAAILQDLAASHLRATAERGGRSPVFEVIERTNSIMVAAAREQHDIIRALIAGLDEPEAATLPPLRILRLETADAQNLATALSSQYDRRPLEERTEKPVTLTADPGTNAIIVAAHPDLLPEIQGIVDELNEAGRYDVTGREIRIFPLRVARAVELAKTLDAMFPEPPAPVDRRGRPLAIERPQREIVVRADESTNAIIVDAPVQRMAGFEELVAQLDRPQLADATEVRTYPVEHADLATLAVTLRTLAEDGALNPGAEARVPMTIATETVSRTLIVSGPTTVFPAVEKMLQELDVRRPGLETTLRFFKLEHARADGVATMLRDVLANQLAELAPTGAVELETLLNVSSDPKTNTLIISAPTQIMPIAEQVVEQLDAGVSIADPVVRVRTLVFADAEEVAAGLVPVLPTLTSTVTGEAVDVRLVPASGALIMSGHADDLTMVEALIDPLDERPSMDAVDARTFRMEHADAAGIAEIVRSLLDTQQQNDPWFRSFRIRGADSDTRIRVEADPRTNSLIVSAPARTLALAETLIAELDRPNDEEGRAWEVFTPERSQPAALVATVEALMRATGSVSGEAELELIADDAAGVVIAAGEETRVALAMELLGESDRRIPMAPEMDLRIVEVAHGDAATIAATVTSLLGDRNRWPATLRQAVRAGHTVANPSVTPDPGGQRVLVSAPRELAVVATEMIEQLDRPVDPDGAADMRVFHLVRADAQDVATALEAAITARARTRGASTQPVVTAEASSNSVIVTAARADMVEVDALIASLDTGVALDQAQVRTVFLKHGLAEAIAPVVESLLTQQSDDVPWWRRDEMPDAAIRVAADSRLNAVVLSAPGSMLDIAEAMVTQLDVDPATTEGGMRRSVRVLTLTNADATELAGNLEAVFTGDGAGLTPPSIRVDSQSNSLIVRATDDQFRAIDDVVQRLDRAGLATTRHMRMVPIDPARANAADVARTIESLLDRGEGGGVEVISLEELLERRRLTEPADQPRRDSRGATPLRLDAIVTALVFAVQDNGAVDEADEPAITLAVDPRTNTIVVMGPPHAVERIELLARELEGQLPPAPAAIHYVTLPQSLDARTVANTISSTMKQLGPMGQRAAVVADVAGNAVVVAANDADFAIVTDLLAAIAQPGTPERIVIRVFPLTNITAERALRSISDLIGPGRGGRNRQAERMREIAVEMIIDGQTIDAVLDPARVRASADQQANALLVAGPAESMAVIEGFVELIDQTPVNVDATLKLYPMRHARADELRHTLEHIFRARFQANREQLGSGAIRPTFAADERSNTLIVTGSAETLSQVDGLLEQLDTSTEVGVKPLRIIQLKAAKPTTVAGILDKVVIGGDQVRRAATLIVPDDDAGVLLVRADEAAATEIDTVLAEIDRDGAVAFPVRTITLERASAEAVSRTVQRFYDDRARIAGEGRGRRAEARRVSIIGDPSSNTLMIAASDEDFAEIEALVAQFDTAQATRALTYRVFELEHAKARAVRDAVQELIDDITYNQSPFMWWGGPQSTNERGTLAVRADERLNALIVTGEGDKFELVEELVGVLDAPTPAGGERVVKVYRPRQTPINTLEDVLEDLFTNAGQRRWWEDAAPGEMQIIRDRRRNLLLIAATASEHDEIAKVFEAVDGGQLPDQKITVLPVEYAEADEIAGTLADFFEERADALNGADPTIVITASTSANALIVSSDDGDLATVRDLLTRLDQQDATGERSIDIIVVADGDALEIAEILREQFGRRGGQGIVVTPDVRTNSLIINATGRELEQARLLIARLDAPPAADESVIRTYTLGAARADDVVLLLTDALKLDGDGETQGVTVVPEGGGDPVEVKAQVVADRRSNSLIVAATAESIPIIEGIINSVDDVPSVNPQQWRIIPLEHAKVFDVSFTLRQLFRNLEDGEPPVRIDYHERENQLIIAATTDQFTQIDELLGMLDQPPVNEQRTEFIPLKFAEAAKVREALTYFYGNFAPGAETPAAENVRIVANPATNSLVISAGETEWEAIRELLTKLDSAEYDTSLQLRVIGLTFADAGSVARAINEAFAGRVDSGGGQNPEQQERPREGEEGERPEAGPAPAVLVQSEEWVRVSAEPMANALIVSANRQNLQKIEQIVEQLDQADFAQLPAPRIIAVSQGSPEDLAESLRELYEKTAQQRGRAGLRIVGDPGSSTVIVRAEEHEFTQIRALAEALMQEAASQGLSVHVLSLVSAPAARVKSAIEAAFSAKAEQSRSPLSIEVDAAGNSLVIASTGGLYAEIEATVRELDKLAPAAGQGIFIIDLEHIAPEEARELIETIGLHEKQPDDAISRLVTEPIKVSTVHGRNAILVVANPVDRDTIVGILKAIDSEPELAAMQMRLVRLQNADAAAVYDILESVFDPAAQQSATPLAVAIREQVRRLSVRRDGAAQGDLDLDLTKPIRMVVDNGLNALLVSSTPKNVAAIEEVIAMLDRLPISDAVTVQIFTLENIAADQFIRIVNELFDRGEALGTVPGTDRPAMPAGMVGGALLDRVAISVDPRTNTVIVAGREDAVAFVDVLARRLDTDVATGWVEPRIIPLTHADAVELAATIEAVLVEGAMTGPQATPLREQVGRLRLARVRENGGQVLESDVFQPMTRLVIRADEQLNALIVVGTPMNLEVVSELVTMLDLEAAAPGALVRIYPVEHASASRLAATVSSLFDQQVNSGAIRREDRVIAQADERTNALIVTTSTRSFAVLEELLKTLDSAVPPEIKAIRMIELENASAARLAGMIQQMMDARFERLQRIQPQMAELERVTVVADSRTNALVVAAGNESFTIVEQLASDLDVSTLEDMALIRVITVEKGNIERIASVIESIMERRYAELPPEMRQSQKPLVMTDPRTTSLLVAANPEDLAAIEGLVTQLAAAPTNPAIGIHVVPLPSTANAEQLAPRINRMMQERMESLGEARTSSDRVTVESDPASNSLVVAATDENLDIVNGLLDVLVKADEASEANGVEIISLHAGRAEDVVAVIQDLYVEEANRTRGEGTVKVAANERLNAVLVTAPAGDVAQIRRLIAQLDSVKPSTVVEIKYIALKSANALETVALIEDVLSGRGVDRFARRRSEKATVIRYLREMVDGGEHLDEMEVSSAIRQSINLTPDVRTNTVIVSAPRESMTVIDRMIRDLDESSVGAKNIRIFKLAHADATATAEILADLFNLRQGNNLLVLKPREPSVDAGAIGDPGAVPAAPGGLGTELTSVPDVRQQLSITVDSRTNSLLVSGSPNYLDLVDNVVTELDGQDANEREVFVRQLRNAEAAEVARVISEFVAAEQQKLIETIGVEQIGSAARLLEREITIVGDDQSNTVLVSASPRYMDRVEQMIQRLDVDPPQVLIQVLLAEVTLDSSDEWGFEGSAQGSIGSAEVSAGYGFSSAILSSLGVPSISVATSDFSLMLRALESQGRLQVLSNPSVMAANNQEAFIQVGEEIGRPSNTSITNGGVQQTSVEFAETGVVLTVTPSINPDGFVRMDIEPRITDLTNRTTQVSENLEVPILTVRTARTTVTVRDGQTIVLGGLISDRYENRERRVPFFSDVPVIGPLFRSEQHERAKTELLIVLTPHVITSPAEMSRVQHLTDREIDRLSLTEEEKESLRRSFLEYDSKTIDQELPDAIIPERPNTYQPRR